MYAVVRSNACEVLKGIVRVSGVPGRCQTIDCPAELNKVCPNLSMQREVVAHFISRGDSLTANAGPGGHQGTCGQLASRARAGPNAAVLYVKNVVVQY